MMNLIWLLLIINQRYLYVSDSEKKYIFRYGGTEHMSMVLMSDGNPEHGAYE